MSLRDVSSFDGGGRLPSVIEALWACGTPQRTHILTALVMERLTAGELARKLSWNSSALGHHAQALVATRIVLREQKRGKWFYELNSPVTSASKVDGGLTITIRCSNGSSVCVTVADDDGIWGHGPSP